MNEILEQLKTLCQRLVFDLEIDWNQSQTFHGEYNGNFGHLFGRVRAQVAILKPDFLGQILVTDPVFGIGLSHYCSISCTSNSADGVIPKRHIDTRPFRDHVIDLATLVVTVAISNFLREEAQKSGD